MHALPTAMDESRREGDTETRTTKKAIYCVCIWGRVAGSLSTFWSAAPTSKFTCVYLYGLALKDTVFYNSLDNDALRPIGVSVHVPKLESSKLQ